VSNRSHQVIGNNRVLDIRNEEVTGQVKLFTLPGTMNKESYTYQIPSGQSGVMFFDGRSTRPLQCTH
jgi:hypothetical protein